MAGKKTTMRSNKDKPAQRIIVARHGPHSGKDEGHRTTDISKPHRAVHGTTSAKRRHSTIRDRVPGLRKPGP